MALLAWLFWMTPASERMENQYALGLLYALRGPLAAPDGAVVIAIDNRTIDWLRERAGDSEGDALLQCLPAEERRELDSLRGPGSLPRSVYACLLDRLRDVGFPVVAFDVLFSVPGSEVEDAMLAAALREHGAAAILTGVERSTIRDRGAELLVEREVPPLLLFRESASATGVFLVPKSGGPVYGYLRRAEGFEEIPSLPDEVLRLATQSDGKTVPTRSDKAFEYLWLYGPPGTVPTISASDVLSSEVGGALRSLAAASVAFVGSSDPDASDYPDSFPSFFRSRIGADTSGVELLSTAFLNARTDTALRRLDGTSAAGLIVLFAFALGFVARVRSGTAMAAAPIAGLGYVAGAAVAFAQLHLFLPLATPVFVVAPAAFVVAVFIRYRLARTLIMRLAPAPAARRMLTKSTGLRGAAVTHDATIVFFDLIGSTSIAEKVMPDEFNTLLNAYFDKAVEGVEDQHGQIAAFSGDGITAIFTGSHHHQNHAVRACRAIIAILAEMRAVNADSLSRSLPPLHMRVGLNSGEVTEGEIGARDRFNFSVVGDVVNLAARLEQMGKTLFPGESDVVLLGETTHRMADAANLVFQDCGYQEIRGREQRERVFRLEATPGQVDRSSARAYNPT
jgi:adenylate cyclase